MTLGQFIKQNRDTIDNSIRTFNPYRMIDNAERKQAVATDPWLTNLAIRNGVDREKI